MTCLTLNELKLQVKKSTDNHKRILEDINSTKPYSEKIYLQGFNKIIEQDKKINYCNNLNNSNYSNGNQLFINYYSSNNVFISGINHTNYVGNSSPSPF